MREYSWLPPLPAGRQPAGMALLGWLDDDRAPRLCRVSGVPGSGKSLLVTWLDTVCRSADGPGRPAAALSMAGLGVEAATWLLSRQLGYCAQSTDQLVAELGTAALPCLLLAWDLGQAADPTGIVEQLLIPLLALSGMRIVVETATGSAEEGALAAGGPAAVMDLDAPQWTDPVRFARWYGRLGGRSPFTAAQVYPNPSLAKLAATVPPGAPSERGTVAAWWSTVSEPVRPTVQALALADQPLTTRQWALLPDAGRVPEATQWLAFCALPDGRWSLPAGPVRDAVLDGVAVDHRVIAQRLTERLAQPTGDGRMFVGADQDLLAVLLGHAVRGGVAQPLLDDPLFLVSAAPRAVTAALAARPGTPLAAAWMRAGYALIDEQQVAVRAAVLDTRLRGTAEAIRLPNLPQAAWRGNWGHWRERSARPLVAMASGQGALAGRVLLADVDGALVLLDQVTGEPAGAPGPAAVPAGIRSLVCLADGTVAALDGGQVGDQGVVRVVFGSGAAALDGLKATAVAGLPAIGDGCGAVHWLGGLSTQLQTLHNGAVTALGGYQLPTGGEVLLVSGGVDGTVRAWKPSRAPMPSPVDSRSCPVVAVDVGGGPQGLIVASAWRDGLVRVRRLGEAGRTVDVRLGSAVHSLAVTGSGSVLVGMADGVVSVRLTP
ncbi:hypothetical protein LN042_23930 [Kitasatospora sp. RB6PN24]|uniref:hypothetical protein n=1 Tax=Kitasatospora humi TaxID=2893891 RepID=UPI001E4BF8A6|nr:hypothetical protein [Kitasatospora humi]MCC9310080.1 hypothetical protein [Kitasatospora humi]